MPYTIEKYDSTPNPDALKCVVAPPIPPLTGHAAMRSYSSHAAAVGDPAGAALIGVSGVRSVLIGDGWVTINKQPTAQWKAVKAGVEAALKGLA